MSRFDIMELPLAGLVKIKRQQMGDSRGFLSRLFCSEELANAGWSNLIAQINHTVTTKKGTIRGMHFQHPPHMEMKLITCIRGEVWDVAVDLRKESDTFLKWHAEHLSAENGCALLIPEGFAHGFQAVADNTELIYCHSSAYAPEAEGGLNPHDPKLNIDWPLETTEISTRDTQHPMVKSNFLGLAV